MLTTAARRELDLNADSHGCKHSAFTELSRFTTLWHGDFARMNLPFVHYYGQIFAGRPLSGGAPMT